MSKNSSVLSKNKWLCATELSGGTKGFNHPGIMGFQGKAFLAFIREMIQNALDANRGIGFIRVIIKHLEILRSDIPDIDGLVDIITRCKEGEKDKKVVASLDKAIADLSKDKIHVLQLADYNTKGLMGSVNDVNSTAHALLKADGVTNKADIGATGSFGIGKFAQYTLSNARATIVSSVSCEDDGTYRPLVQGKAILKSHKRYDEALGRDVIYKDESFFGPDDGNFDAAYEYGDLPDWLRRGDGSLGPDTQGTTISVLAFNYQENWKELMIGLTLQNFFAAILYNQLELEIGDVVINKDTIQSLFTDLDVVNAVRDFGRYDEFEMSYFYYKALTSENSIKEVVNIPELGDVEMTILIDRSLPRQVVFNRNGMKITDQMAGLKRFRMVKPFACVVEPLDKEARETLRQMEPPAHDDFLPGHASDEAVGRRILKALEATVKQFIDTHAGFKASQESNVTELSDLLADTTDDQNGDCGEYNIHGAVKISDETKTIGFGGRKYGSVSVGTLNNDGETETVSGGKVTFEGPENPPGPPNDRPGIEPTSGNGFNVSSPASLDLGGDQSVEGTSEGKKGVRMHVKHRGVLKGKRQFKLETLVKEPVKLEIAFQRNGLSESDDLVVVSSSVGEVVNGKVHVELDQNNSRIEVTFDRDFRGGSVGIVAHAI